MDTTKSVWFQGRWGYIASRAAIQLGSEECLDAAARGETSVTIDRGDLTDGEAEYLQKEVRRRLGG